MASAHTNLLGTRYYILDSKPSMHRFESNGNNVSLTVRDENNNTVNINLDAADIEALRKLLKASSKKNKFVNGTVSTVAFAAT